MRTSLKMCDSFTKQGFRPVFEQLSDSVNDGNRFIPLTGGLVTFNWFVRLSARYNECRQAE